LLIVPEKCRVVSAFDHSHGSSDGGAILLVAANQRFGDALIESLSSCLQDARQQGRVDHALTEPDAAAHLQSGLRL